MADLRAVHGPRRRADARPRRQRAHGRPATRADRDGQPSPRAAARRGRLRARVPHPRGAPRRRRLVGRGRDGARRRARGDELRRRAPAADGLHLRQQPVGLLDADPSRLRGRAPRRPRAGVRLRGRRRRRHRRARRLPRGEARDRQGARRRRADADRVRDAPHGGPRRPRRRVLRAEGAVRGVGQARPDRALPHLAARAGRADRRRGGEHRLRRQAPAERGAREGGGLADARAGRRCWRASTRRPRTSRRPHHK